jgi:hypothetical protein
VQEENGLYRADADAALEAQALALGGVLDV